MLSAAENKAACRPCVYHAPAASRPPRAAVQPLQLWLTSCAARRTCKTMDKHGTCDLMLTSLHNWHFTVVAEIVTPAGLAGGPGTANV